MTGRGPLKRPLLSGNGFPAAALRSAGAPAQGCSGLTRDPAVRRLRWFCFLEERQVLNWMRDRLTQGRVFV
jgi:hypothetical protein